MNKTVEAYLPGETQLVPRKDPVPPADEHWVEDLAHAISEGARFNHTTACHLLEAYKALLQERDEYKEDARNRADRLEQIRRIA